MKTMVLAMMFLLAMVFEGAVLEKDNIVDGRMNIKSKTGEIKGYMRRDSINPNRINIYDKYGNWKGVLVRDILNLDAWLFKKDDR